MKTAAWSAAAAFAASLYCASGYAMTASFSVASPGKPRAYTAVAWASGAIVGLVVGVWLVVKMKSVPTT